MASKPKTPIPQMLFTNRSVEAIVPPETGRVEFKDTKLPGLYLRVSASGVKSFSYVGRTKGASKPDRVTLGRYPVVKADEARTRATELAGRLAAGVSVAAAQRERRGELTLIELRKLVDEDRLKPKKGRKAQKAGKTPRGESLWRLYIEPKFGRRRLSEIEPSDVEAWHRAIPQQVQKARAERTAAAAARQAERRQRVEAAQALRRRGPLPKAKPESEPSVSRVDGFRTANLALSELRAMFTWAMNPRRKHFVGLNPASGQDAFPDVERERFLEEEEMAKFFEALSHATSETMRDFFLIALLTGARRSNVAAMAWADVNLERGEWSVSGAEMKNGKSQILPLDAVAVEILRNRKPEEGGSPWVFPSDRSKAGHVVEPKGAWKALLREAGIDDLRIHDLRHTLGSWQARMGSSELVIGKSLNHLNGKSTKRYVHLQVGPVRQSVERATSAMYEAAALKPKAKVIELKPAAKRPKAVKALKG